MVFYVEACESGSMFKVQNIQCISNYNSIFCSKTTTIFRHQGLLDPSLNVFATTASNATTSSFACYFDKVLLWMVSINDDDNYNGCDVLLTVEQILLG